jgi:hypothetical protein
MMDVSKPDPMGGGRLQQSVNHGFVDSNHHHLFQSSWLTTIEAYFTNNEGIPLPDCAHSKNIGGIPLVSDVHLLQKQQHFNRSKNLESESAIHAAENYA